MSGYHVIEPTELVPLITRTAHHSIAVAILTWVTQNLNARFNTAGIWFEVIPVEYVGRYPAIGAQYESTEGCADTEEEILAEISRILSSTTLLQILPHLASKASWANEASRIIDDAY